MTSHLAVYNYYPACMYKGYRKAGVDPSDSGPGRFPLDGLDVWPIIAGENTTTPHKEIMPGFNFTN